MSSYPQIDVVSMDLTPCQISFKPKGSSASIDLGGTLDNVKVKMKYSMADIKADQFGTTPLDSRVTGFEATVETALTQFKDFSQVLTIFPYASSVSPDFVVTGTIAAPAVFTTVLDHHFVSGEPIKFTPHGGALPTGINSTTTYYVLPTGLTATDFEISATVGGSAIALTVAGSGTMTVKSQIPQAVDFNTNVGAGAVAVAGELTLHPQSSDVGDVSHDWTLYNCTATAESELDYSPTAQGKMKIVWKVYPDFTFVPARFMRYGDKDIGT